MKAFAANLALAAVMVLAACDSVSPTPPADSSPAPFDTPAATAVGTAAATTLLETPAAPSETPTNLAVAGPYTLVVWLPPQFDPSSTVPGADLLRARLAAFQAANPDITIQVRIKAASGAGGLVDALAITSAAAPVNLPGLIALTRSDMESAALKGLIFPLDTLSPQVNDPDWYDYAHQLEFIQGSAYGLPFAGDAQLLMYRPSKMPAAPGDWPGLFSQKLPLAFPAGDPQSMLTLNLYLSAGGSIKDPQGRPILQAGVLAKVLKIYADGLKEGAFSSALAQYQTDGQAWQAYRDQPPKAQAVVSWSSRFLSELPADTTAISLPSLGAQPYALATGWEWALAEPDPNRRAAAVRLAEYLSASEFLSQWTAAAGYLPTRPSALAGWSNQNLKTILSPVELSAQARPSNDLLASLGPVLQDATLQVIKQQVDPSVAAQSAAERLAVPPAK